MQHWKTETVFSHVVARFLGGIQNPQRAVAMDVCRWTIAICQAATILLTWQLWQVREFPPLLPTSWFPSIVFDVGVVLLVSLGLVVLFPRWGSIVHALLLAVAMGMDQTRIQPQIFSCAVLMMATTPARTPTNRRTARREKRRASFVPVNAWLFLGRVHLIAIWFYSGFHKLISPAYYQPGSTLSQLFVDTLPGSVLLFLSGTLAVTEMAIAAMVIFPRTRKIACVVAGLLHIGIVLVLASTGWNTSVWPWNVAVLVSAFAFFWSWADRVPEVAAASPVFVRAIATISLAMPLGYYLEWTDAHFAYCLYSRNKAIGYTFRPDRTKSVKPQRIGGVEYVDTLNVPLPPEHRLIRASFLRSNRSRPEDVLFIRDPRLGGKLRGRHERWFRMTETREVEETDQPARVRWTKRP